MTPDHDPDRDARLRAELESERANAGDLRRVVAEQRHALHALRSRRSVRALLAVERRALVHLGGARRARERLARGIARASLAARALPSLAGRRRRAAFLADGLARLPVPVRPLVSTSLVVATGGGDCRGIRPEDAEVEVVAVGPVREAEAPPGADRVVTALPGEARAASIARAIEETTGEWVCVLAPGVEPMQGNWLARLGSALGGDVVAATPAVLHPDRPIAHATPHDLRVRSLGVAVDVCDGAPVPVAVGAGTPPAPDSAPAEVVASTSACLLAVRDSYDRVGGLRPFEDLDAAVFDLCARLRAAGGRIMCVPSSVVADHRRPRSRAELTRSMDPAGAGWRAIVDAHGPALLRGVAPLPESGLRVALTCAAPSAKVAARWGDWHLATALARSLERLGHAVRVQTADHADDPAGRSCDVHVVLRGLTPVRRSSGQCHVLWVISHPETVDDNECEEADLVLVASERFARRLRERTSTPVEVMLQATDPQRFHRTTVRPRFRYDVAFVGKSRDVLRPAVADAQSAGLRPAVIGSGWEGFVDPSLVVSGYVPNEQLPEVYSSVGVLLNDHWDTMRAWGFVSNRLFDALACATPVVSDFMPEIAELFGDAVATYRTPQELRMHVESVLADPEAARRRAEEGRRIVLDSHTFDVRARALVGLLAAHGQVPGPRPGTRPTG